MLWTPSPWDVTQAKPAGESVHHVLHSFHTHTGKCRPIVYTDVELKSRAHDAVDSQVFDAAALRCFGTQESFRYWSLSTTSTEIPVWRSTSKNRGQNIVRVLLAVFQRYQNVH